MHEFFGLLLSIATLVEGFPGGAPKSSCANLRPNHGLDAQPETSNPYKIVTEELDDGDMKVTLSGDDFRGFIIRGFNSDGSPAGSFVPNNDAQILTCSGKTSVTHKSSSDKSSVSLNWSPGCKTCNVYFNFTVVKDYANYWVKIKSDLLEIA